MRRAREARRGSGLESLCAGVGLEAGEEVGFEGFSSGFLRKDPDKVDLSLSTGCLDLWSIPFTSAFLTSSSMENKTV